MTLLLDLSEEDIRLIQNYAEQKNQSVSDVVRDAVVEKIEDEIDLALYEKAIKEHRENPDVISFDEVLKEING